MRRKCLSLSTVLISLLIGSLARAGEEDLKLPELDDPAVTFFANTTGHDLLIWGLLVCVLGMAFGLAIFMRLRDLPVHRSMREISELIYGTCKTYLLTQGRFILSLWLLIGAIILIYFGYLKPFPEQPVLSVTIILLFSLIGILGSYSVAWFGIRVNTFANSRTAFASLRGKPYLTYAIPIQAGMSIGMLLISIELLIMLAILLFIPGSYAGACFIGFAIGESLGAAALRIAGGIFTKIADIGSDLMKIIFKIKEDDARNPGVIADCTGDNAGDSVGPTADGFETYGVTGVALIAFILLAVPSPVLQVQLLVWVFVMRIMMIVTSALSYGINSVLARARYGKSKEMNFETPLTTLVWLTSVVSVAMTYLISYLLIAEVGDGTMWWKLSTIITCGTMAGAIIPELVKIFTSTESKHVREVVTASREGGASLNVLSGLVAGNFSAYWMGITIVALMAIAYGVSTAFPANIMAAPTVFAFGLVAFGFLGMGPVTIAVDSYGPVTDNAQSIYELSMIESIGGIKKQIKKEFGFRPDFERAKHFLEQNDGAGNTFKATAKPVLIGTAVTGATTLIFSTVVLLARHEAEKVLQQGAAAGAMVEVSAEQALKSGAALFSMLNAPFLLGLVLGGAVIYWFTGASIQAVATGAYEAVAFIKRNIRLDGSAQKASLEDSKRVVEICTRAAQSGMKNIFVGVFFTTLALAVADPYLFVGYLISIAIFGLYQAIFMANTGGAWDNAKKLVEVELNAKGTALHDASVVGDTVGDPFKDTSSVALNPVIKFTTLFGLLAVELALQIRSDAVRWTLAILFFAVSIAFVLRSFYGMRIKGLGTADEPDRSEGLEDSEGSEEPEKA